ncbi:MAG: ester cyclase [Pseudomonadota bacterium]
MTKPITQVATTDITQMMDPGPERRMTLPGFADEFVDFPHYIIRITELIWHDRQVERIHDWYAPDCAIHTLAGDITGAQTVVNNTWATLDAFPDRRLDGDNVIWSDDGDGKFYSSHLITSKMTNSGDSEFGPATGRPILIQTIADCLCKDNQVIEEWLVRDNLAAAVQLGFDPDEIARAQANADRENAFNLVEFHADNRARAATGESLEGESGSASSIAIAALNAIWDTRDWTAANTLYDFRVAATYPGAANLYGPDQIRDWLAPLHAAVTATDIVIEHIAEIPYLGDAKDVAIRWSVAGVHSGSGRYGPATAAPVYILGVSQFRVMNGRIREEVTIWDDLAVRRQIETARLAKGG